jgi:hypothetical protein
MNEVMVRVQIPDGFELACDEMRRPLPGEWYLTTRGAVERAIGLSCDHDRVIVRPIEKWNPPEWMKPGWIAMDEDKIWLWHENEPVECQDWWSSCKGPHFDLSNVNWTPPLCDDWRKSKRRIRGKK